MSVADEEVEEAEVVAHPSAHQAAGKGLRGERK
jgi:hypothetical protein